MSYKDMLMAGAAGAAAVFVARKIPSLEKVLDGAPAGLRRVDIGLPHITNSANGFPLGYVVAPVALAMAIHKYL